MQRNWFKGAVCLFALLLTPHPFVLAADYMGAAAVLEKSSQKKQSTEEEKSSGAGELKRDIQSFKKQNVTLAPDEAARQWLALLDRQLNLSPAEIGGAYTGLFQAPDFDPNDIWKAMPGPWSWEALRKAVEVRPESKDHQDRELGLRIIVHTLVSDYSAQTNDLAHMEVLATNASSEEENPMLIITAGFIRKYLLKKSNNPEIVLKSLKDQLATGNPSSELSVPNLVPLVGEERAADFFRNVFSNSAVKVEIEQGEDTKKLARKIALEMIGQLSVPQWNLACSLDAGPLFEAMEKKFGTTEPETNKVPDEFDFNALVNKRNSRNNGRDGKHVEARIFYLLILISQNRTKEAADFAQKLKREDSASIPATALQQLERAGYAGALHDFFNELLTQNPDMPFWNDYISLSATVGETDKMLDLVRKTAARDDLSAKRRDALRQNLYRALLAADHVDEGIAEVQKILAQPIKAGNWEDSGGVASRGDLALTVAKIGLLTDNTNWLEQGIAATRAALNPIQGLNPVFADYYATQLRQSFADFLMMAGRGPQAESILSEGLEVRPPKGEDAFSWRDSSSRAYLAGLVSVYFNAARYADVVMLLDKAPDWEVGDLGELHESDADNIHQHADSLEDLLRYHAAASLLEMGRKEEAAKIANAILDENGGYDPAYEVLAKIGGAEVMRRLDELFARDQFEERPLIWKAVLLQQGGKLEEAEAVARRAISIDPSDGEQGPGRRMRAYAVLADIRKARGDEKESDFFHNAVEAIRLSEKADRYYEAGLLKQAVNMYEDSLMKFEGAYCIQSRLALRLSELGKNDEAAEHFRRAYELMPDSFGRVESHCFGCERAFENEQAQKIADKVFTALVKSAPQKPQVHYLLGYLREEQGNYPEALKYFREAVQLDPDYLNAWKHVGSTGAEAHLSDAERDSVLLNILRLDPLGRHGGNPSTSGATDLRAVWNAFEAAEKLQPVLSTNLYSLPASKAQIENAAKTEKGWYLKRAQAEARESSGRHPNPAQAVTENAIISTAIQLFGDRYSDD